MAEPASSKSEPAAAPVNFETHPSRYRHWHLSVDGRVATLTMDVDEEAGIRPGYQLKLNSYDLGVDISSTTHCRESASSTPRSGR